MPYAPKPITIRGVTYPSVKVAAATFGISIYTIYQARLRGQLQNVGLGPQDQPGCSVRIRGVVYPNARVAGEALGLTPSAITAAVRQGRQDRVGLPYARCHPAKPITLAGHRFPSMSAASRALGRQPGFVSEALRLGEVGRARLLRAVMALDAKAVRRLWKEEEMMDHAAARPKRTPDAACDAPRRIAA